MKEYAKDFYKSAAWKRARQTVIKRANGLCERCRAAGLYRPGVIVHHKDYITPENIHNPGVTLNLDNLEYLCEDCHNKEHKAKPNNRYRFDSDGKLLISILDKLSCSLFHNWMTANRISWHHNILCNILLVWNCLWYNTLARLYNTL